MSEKLLLNNYILFLDTSNPEARIALYLNDDKNLLHEIKWLAGRELSATLLDKYQEFLKSAKLESEDLTAICVFVGPGSFTGLRIGISFINGLAFSLKIPVYETKIRNEIKLENPKKIAVPFYGSEPNITKPKDNK
jgi:tRNA threonylcarbamoyladenosine biosynthesis protein TsaB